MLALRRNAEGEYDLVEAEDGSLAHGNDLHTAIAISLHTDAAIDPSESANDARRGFWGDELLEGPELGSADWAIASGKASTAAAQDLEDSAHKALQWLIDDGVASSIEVTAALANSGRIERFVRVHLVEGGSFEDTFPG